MQQLCLRGKNAVSFADRLFHALNILPVGLRIAPFTVDGEIRGDAAHLLPAPATPMHNAVPCRVFLGEGKSAIIPEALEEVAAPGLLAAMRIQAPVLLTGLTGSLLSCTAFREAVRTCLMSLRPMVIASDDSAAEILRTLTPADRQIWFTVPEDAQEQATLLETLLPEAALRF